MMLTSTSGNQLSHLQLAVSIQGLERLTSLKATQLASCRAWLSVWFKCLCEEFRSLG